jgi:hypothetical protein
MRKKSKYDEIHNKYWDASTTKSGTLYERLVAFVIKSLRKTGHIIHDIKLTGESDVKHQIDVIIEEPGKNKRVLIECKDFEKSGDKVGLSIVRNFWGVVDDIHPDEAIVITCNGFTSEAHKYAKNKGIKLAILREFTNADMESRIKKMIIRTHFLDYSQPKVNLYINEQDMENIPQGLKNCGISDFNVDRYLPVYLNLREGKKHFFEFIEEKILTHPIDRLGHITLKLPLENATIEVEGRIESAIQGLTIDFDVFLVEKRIERTSDKVAQLIVEGFGDTDIIVFADDLRRLNINRDTGEVNETK